MTQLGLGFFTRGVLGSLQLAGAVRGFLDHSRGLLGYQDWDVRINAGEPNCSYPDGFSSAPSLPLRAVDLSR